MDESWRMRMGMPTTPPLRHVPSHPPRRSAGDTAFTRRKPISEDSLEPEDFRDVFGGAPHTILSRQFSASGLPASHSTASFFYEEIFRPPEKAAPAVRRNGRSLPQFRIPGQQRSSHGQHKRESDGFYSDIFGWEDEQRVVRSRSRSKASTSSALSSEEISPLRPAVSVDDGDDISLFASKLRPINVRSRWNSGRMGHEGHQGQHNLPRFAGVQLTQSTVKDCLENLRICPFGFDRRNASPETISLEPISNGSFRVSADDLELNSPSSAVSSVCQMDREYKTHEIEEHIFRQGAAEQEEDEIMSSYVIEISSENREGTCESNGVDEAIAWAKEKSQMHCPMLECEKEKTTEEMMKVHQLAEGHANSFASMDEQEEKWAAEEETPQLESMVKTEMLILDEKLKLWSTGKEADIRLLLSSLHHILWPNSGWLAIPLTNLIETSQVKKAYQKARLCLHPDKLQQRGATLPQKYIAEKAFSVVQDAWASFISQDAFCR